MLEKVNIENDGFVQLSKISRMCLNPIISYINNPKKYAISLCGVIALYNIIIQNDTPNNRRVQCQKYPITFLKIICFSHGRPITYTNQAISSKMDSKWSPSCNVVFYWAIAIQVKYIY